MRLERTAEPCAVVIFGASGDLAKRKLIPALYRLVQERLLPAEFAIVGLGRTRDVRRRVPRQDEGGRRRVLRSRRRVDEEVWQIFAQGFTISRRTSTTPESYAKLAHEARRG